MEFTIDLIQLRRFSRCIVSHLVMLSALGLVACTELGDTAQVSAGSQDQAVFAEPGQYPPGKGVTLARKPCVGGYHADQISGDFAGYARLQQFVEQMVHRHGFDREYLQGLFSQAKRKDWTLNYFAKGDQSLKLPPSKGSWTRYRAKFLDERHIGAGAEFARRYRSALQRATRMYGVPEEYILGIMAIETNFGSNLGNHRVLDALTTLGFDYARRGPFFRDELEEFLLMARSEGLDPVGPKGSFAGAMGLGQFMPSSFRKWAVDFNGDGHRDLWNPEDAIGSIANYFAQHGWQPGQPVITPLAAKRPVALQAGFDTRYTPGSLFKAGLQPTQPCTANGQVCLLLLRHQRLDQYLIGYPNFYTITRYNHSTHYAMAVHELAQAIKHRM
ncbi:MAG: lytic murein transglycosylase B [Desulfobulbus sp.]|nr:lytic murein transglycosylase B [Desulfobulbus sp.]